MVVKLIKQPAMQAESLFPIGTVSDQTGVPAVTLRAWERRYSLLKPSRTPKGHRLYSQQDIQRVKQVLRLLDQGIPVSRAQDFLCKHAKEAKSASQVIESGIDTCELWKEYTRLCRRFIYKLDAKSLETVIDEAIESYSLEQVANHLLIPLCHDLYGQCCLLSSTRADHAFWYQFLTAKLSAYYLNAQARAESNQFRVIVIGVSCQMVYLQTLLLVGTLSTQGFQVSLLGADCRPEHLPLVLERSHFDAVIYCNPNQEVIAGLEVLSRMSNTILSVHYLQRDETLTVPESLVCLPAGFNAAGIELESLLANKQSTTAT